MKKSTRQILGLEIHKCRKQLQNKKFMSTQQVMLIQHELHELEEELEGFTKPRRFSKKGSFKS